MQHIFRLLEWLILNAFTYSETNPQEIQPPGTHTFVKELFLSVSLGMVITLTIAIGIAAAVPA
ncbi:MAG: hypothetical protein KAI17_19220 [Thiotrichaceae bacterium]|nr:hypothetical protein [Thiotrichaceae bacterium]